VRPLTLAFRHLTRNATATVIALVAITAAVACGGVLLRLYRLAETRFATLVDGPDAVVGAKAPTMDILLGALNAEGEPPGTIPGALYRTLRDRPVMRMEDGTTLDLSAVRRAVPLLCVGRIAAARVFATDGEFFAQSGAPSAPLLKRGRWFGQSGEAVLGRGVARALGVDVGDSVNMEAARAGFSPGRLRVAGVFTSGGSAWEGCAFTSLGGVQHSGGPDAVHYVLLYLRPGSAEQVARLVDARTVAQYVDVHKEEQRLAELGGVGVRFGVSITVLVILLAGLAVAAVMITRFEGMATELAVFQAIGFTLGELGAWLVCEGLLLALPACLLGAVAEYLALPPLRALMGSALPPVTVVSGSPAWSAPVWGAAVLVTVCAVAVPFLRLLRQDTPATLRRV